MPGSAERRGASRCRSRSPTSGCANVVAASRTHRGGRPRSRRGPPAPGRTTGRRRDRRSRRRSRARPGGRARRCRRRGGRRQVGDPTNVAHAQRRHRGSATPCRDRGWSRGRGGRCRRWRRKYDAAIRPARRRSRRNRGRSGRCSARCLVDLHVAAQHRRCGSDARWPALRASRVAASTMTTSVRPRHPVSSSTRPLHAGPAERLDACPRRSSPRPASVRSASAATRWPTSASQGSNQDMTLDDALDGVRRICSAVPRGPVTADMEAGYGATPQESSSGLLRGRRRRPQHRGHRALRGRADALGGGARRLHRRDPPGGGRGRRRPGRQRAHRRVPQEGPVRGPGR